MSVVTILYSLLQKNLLFAQFYLAGLSNQVEALPVFALNGVKTVNNVLHRELRPVVLDLHLVAAFALSGFTWVLGPADHIDQELKPNALWFDMYVSRKKSWGFDFYILI